MNEHVNRLAASLGAIGEAIAAKGNPSRAAWYDQAVRSSTEIIKTYKTGLEEAIAAGSSEGQIEEACRISGISKGISDLGILHLVRDAGLIDTIDKADRLATEICLSGTL